MLKVDRAAKGKPFHAPELKIFVGYPSRIPIRARPSVSAKWMKPCINNRSEPDDFTSTRRPNTLYIYWSTGSLLKKKKPRKCIHNRM